MTSLKGKKSFAFFEGSKTMCIRMFALSVYDGKRDAALYQESTLGSPCTFEIPQRKIFYICEKRKIFMWEKDTERLLLASCLFYSLLSSGNEAENYSCPLFCSGFDY